MYKDMDFNKITVQMSWQEKLKYIASFDNVTFSTSFSLEDQVITDFIIKNNLNIDIFTIDTGRLFPETYSVWQETIDFYQAKISAYYPDQIHLNQFVSKEGINSFYKSKELRRNCCHIRKVEPLTRALSAKSIWISGLRHEHSDSRSNKSYFEYDDNLKVTKFYPLLASNIQDIRLYIEENNIPYNKLYDNNFESIGCAPCTREGSGRDGRWWWEESSKECGIHIENGTVIRINKQ